MHPRTEIRFEIEDILKDTTLDVYTSRVFPLDSVDDLPCVIIYTKDEQSQSISWHEDERVLDIIIECYSNQSDNLDNDLDDIAEIVENAIILNKPNLLLTSTSMQMDAFGETPVGTLILNYTTKYLVNKGQLL
jgi:hypothetical protein